MPALGQTQMSGLVPVQTTPTEMIKIPLRACQPCHLCIRNEDGAATLYLKSASDKTGTKLSLTDYGIRLEPGESYDWGGSPPRGVSIMGITTVAGSFGAVEANWCDLSEEGHA